MKIKNGALLVQLEDDNIYQVVLSKQEIVSIFANIVQNKKSLLLLDEPITGISLG